ncbi:hypothetical protein CKM354_000419100 [Cercospora kikuchii]|uniref:Uncharacterized protein n=1 Tax=Cercospora kikuchii TaxID=84275 RepID=A0A9P3CB07_9PEZI|nr:uncharacterized protein CKM354_000419100 [Cercospora kikuchii]GIZ40869.1 hypothetical protein CKM354_000419100 [Cercospora kikuchii]
MNDNAVGDTAMSDADSGSDTAINDAAMSDANPESLLANNPMAASDADSIGERLSGPQYQDSRTASTGRT